MHTIFLLFWLINPYRFRSVKSVGINVIKKGIKMGTTGFSSANKSSGKKQQEKTVLSPDMFDFSTGEASALGFEPLAAQTAKPEISVVSLSEYTQVLKKPELAHLMKEEETNCDTKEIIPATKPRVVTFDVPTQVKASQNSLRIVEPILLLH